MVLGIFKCEVGLTFTVGSAKLPFPLELPLPQGFVAAYVSKYISVYRNFGNYQTQLSKLDQDDPRRPHQGARPEGSWGRGGGVTEVLQAEAAGEWDAERRRNERTEVDVRLHHAVSHHQLDPCSSIEF